MKVKTNFKKMFLVDNLSGEMKDETALNDNTILNRYIETKDVENVSINKNNRDEVIDNEINILNDTKYGDNYKKIVDSEKEKDVDGIENMDNDEQNEIIKMDEGIKNPNHNKSISEENNDTPLTTKKAKNFNLAKCIDGCFKASALNYDKGLNNTDNINKNKDEIKINYGRDDENADSIMEDDYEDDIDDEKEEKKLLSRLQKIRNDNDDETIDSIMDNNYDDDIDDENEEEKLLSRLQKIREDKKILSKKKKRLYLPSSSSSSKYSILSKYKQKKYPQKHNFLAYLNRKRNIRNDRDKRIKHKQKNFKRKASIDEESFDEPEAKRKKENELIRAITLNENVSDDNSILEEDEELNESYSDDDPNNLESSNENESEMDFEDNISDSPYNLRKNRRKNVKYQDYIKNDLVCRNCEKEFGNEKALDNHVKTCQITSFACSNCGKNYKTKWGLITHRKNMHSKIKRKKNIT